MGIHGLPILPHNSLEAQLKGWVLFADEKLWAQTCYVTKNLCKELEVNQNQQSQMIKNLERLVSGIKYLVCQLTQP